MKLLKNQKFFVWIFILAIIVIVLGCQILYRKYIMVDFVWKYDLLNPIIKYNEWENLMKEKEIDFKTMIENYVNLKLNRWEIEHVSVYFRSLNNGDRIGINEKEYFSPASLMKLPILISYLKKSESEKGLLEKKVIYKKNDQYEETFNQNFEPIKDLENGKEYTFKELLEYMIRYSNNEAAIVLQENINLEQILATFYDVWLWFPVLVDWKFDNNIKVKDYATFFRILFNSSYLNKENSEWALELLSTTVFNDGIKEVLPKNIQVAHKFGERWIIWPDGTEQKQLHDCGIIYYPQHPYILCLMTRWYDWDKLKWILQDISKIVYDQIENSYSNLSHWIFGD